MNARPTKRSKRRQVKLVWAFVNGPLRTFGAARRFRKIFAKRRLTRLYESH